MPTPDRIAAAGVMREGPPAGPRPVREVVSAVTTKVDQGRWREGGALLRVGADTGQKIARQNEEIGITYVDGKKTRNHQERARFQEANKWAARNEKFLRVGYDGMDPTPGGEQDLLRADVLTAAGSFPVFRDRLATMNPAEQKAFAERILREGGVSVEGKKIFDTLLDPERRLISDGEIFEKQGEAEKVKNAKESKDKEVKDIKDQVTAVEQQLRRFERDDTGIPTGTDAIELDRLRGLRATHQAELTTLKRDLGTKQTNFDNLTDEYNGARSAGWTGRAAADVLAERNTARTELDTLKTNISNREADLEKLRILEQDEQKLREQKTTLGKEQIDRELEAGQLDIELKQKQRELDDKRRVRETEEKDLVNGYKNLIREAAGEALQGELTKLSEAANEELEKRKQGTTDANERALLDAAGEYYLDEPRWRGVFRRTQYRPINEQRVRDNWDTVISQGEPGVEEVMVTLFQSQIDPETGHSYTAAKARDLLRDKGEESLYQKIKPDVLKKLIANRANTRGLSQEDVWAVTTSAWGQGMITEGLNLRKEARAEIARVMGEGALSGPGFFERFRNEVRRNPWLLLLALGVIPVALVGAPLAAVGAAAAAGPAAEAGYGAYRAANNPIQPDLAA